MFPAPVFLPAPPSAEAHTLEAWSTTYSTWLLENALPLWWEQGTDHRQGGFFERISPDGAVLQEPRRTRVTSRQIYVFTVGHALGWGAPALSAVQHGLDFLLRRQRKDDGTFASAVLPDGTIVDNRFDLYEQAFALFALARAYQMQPAWSHLPDLALGLLGTLRARWQHPGSGFHESIPPSLPLRSNPHMHLLEAFLAWAEASPVAQRTPWVQAAGELVSLCMRRLIAPPTGAVKEYFDLDWAPMPDDSGRIIEPGHQYEWGWLLMRWAQGHPEPSDFRAAADRMVRFAERHGVNAHGIAVNELYDDASVKDPAAKLWPQTERIKAWNELARQSADGDARAACLDQAERACRGLWRYIEAARPGMWQEVMKPDGTFDVQPCRASSLYHIVGAIESLHHHVRVPVSSVNTP